MVHGALTRILLVIAACACVLLAVPEHAGAKAKRARCAGASLAPTQANLAQVRAAVLCLHNRERSVRGLPALKENPKLRQAAEGHSTAMVTRAFFSHTSPDGTSMVDRVLRTGYAAGGSGWSIGENIAWGTGTLATAAQIQRAWMNSAGHRTNILRRQFREVGIGIAIGAPAGGSDGATYTADFGVRR
jgi:uncharacterized protein YkwD